MKIARSTMRTEVRGYQIENWLTSEEISKIWTSAYWNDEEKEKEKRFQLIAENKFSSFEKYLRQWEYAKELDSVLSYVKLKHRLKGVFLELASGVCWSVPYFFREFKENITTFYCVEISRHRLLNLAPKLLDNYKVPKDKVILCLGSFYQVKLPNESVDCILLSQSFHHALYPDRLLSECHRVLKPGGMLIITGELFVAFSDICKRFFTLFIKNLACRFPTSLQKLFIKNLACRFPTSLQKRLERAFSFQKTRLFCTGFRELYPIDSEMGDIRYLPSHYNKLFTNAGFTYKAIRRKRSLSFVLINNMSGISIQELNNDQ